MNHLEREKMKETGSRKLAAGVILVLVLIFATLAYSHCQIPCGIYGDVARFEEIAENITTIEKSMKQINELSKEKQANMNQIVRWVANKEKHADDISHIVTYYFMAQRVKPVGDADTEAHKKYVKKLTLLHEMLVYSMKAKQTTDVSNVEKLRSLSGEFRAVYLEGGGDKH